MRNLWFHRLMLINTLILSLVSMGPLVTFLRAAGGEGWTYLAFLPGVGSVLWLAGVVDPMIRSDKPDRV